MLPLPTLLLMFMSLTFTPLILATHLPSLLSFYLPFFLPSSDLHYIKRRIYSHTYSLDWDTRWRSWLRHCATNRKVAGSIPDGVIGIFH